MNKQFIPIALVAFIAAALVGCGNPPETHEERQAMRSESKTALNAIEREHPELHKFIDDAYGYAIFPSIGKGGAVVGGAYGRGEVYEQGSRIGYAEMKQASVGAQLGGQEYRELIVFENSAALHRFTDGKLSFAANASAVALKSGASAAARFEDGVAVFTMPTGGLMFEAGIGGQQFIFQPDGTTSTMKETETKTETRTETK